MKVRTGGRTIEIPDERMRGVREKDTVDATHSGTRAARQGVTFGTGQPTKNVEAQVPAFSYAPYRSKAEAAFARSLEFDKLAGMIKGWSYEPLRFKLPGETNYYKMDFVAWGYADDPRPRFIEIKRGKLQSADRSLVKLKTAAGLNPWGRFMLYTLRRSTWIEREILP